MRDLIIRFVPDAAALFDELPFTLENGEPQLRPFFDRIEIRRVGGELRVTEPRAMIDYVLSVGEAQRTVAGAQLAQLQRVVCQEIDSHGAYSFPTAAGVFIATKAGGAAGASPSPTAPPAA
jgi:hypothetical protein